MQDKLSRRTFLKVIGVGAGIMALPACNPGEIATPIATTPTAAVTGDAAAFTLVTERQVDEIASLVRLYEHNRTGARLLSIINDDTLRSFNISFRAKVADSTGMSHILEHSLLNGSEKFPVKGPFYEMRKRTLAINSGADTKPDRINYYVSSINEKDYYNWIDVIMDGVLHPLLREFTFMQEAWRYEIDDPAQPLSYNGTVYNEMKGSLSSAAAMQGKIVQQSLFPNHPYSFNSGGDLDEIVTLSLDTLRKFWETFYHPSNAFVFMYGNDDPEKRLAVLDGYFNSYEKQTIPSEIPPVEPFAAPRYLEFPYPAEGDDREKKHTLTIAWKWPEQSDPVLKLSLNMLTQMIGASGDASPVRKALTEAGLAGSVASSFNPQLRDMQYGLIMSGIRAEAAEQIETLVYDTLTNLVRDGIDPDIRTIAMNDVTRSLRTTDFPPPLSISQIILANVMTVWPYGGDPFSALAFEEPLAKIHQNLETNPHYFEDLIQTYLLDNQHRVIIHFTPDPEMSARQQAEEEARLKAAKDAMSQAELLALIETNKQFKAWQTTPDTPEALATLPTLNLSDLEPKIKPIPSREFESDGVKILYHDLLTNGIIRLSLAFDLQALPPELLPLASIFARALFSMGTSTESPDQFTQRVNKEVGNMGAGILAATVHGARQTRAFLNVQTSPMMEQAGQAFNILRDTLLHAHFDDQAQFKKLVLKAIAEIESQAQTPLVLVGGPETIVRRRLRGQFGGAGSIEDQVNGIKGLLFLRQLAADVDADWPGVLEQLQTMRQAVINRTNLLCNVTLDGENWQTFRPQLTDFITSLPATEAPTSAFNLPPATQPEGLAVPTEVNYVGKALNLYDNGYKPHGSAAVVNNYLRYTYLVNKIRLEGGAYSAFAEFDHADGIMHFVSYRDPNLDKTLAAYDEAGVHLQTFDAANLDEVIANSIITTIGKLDAPETPGVQGQTAFNRYLSGETDEMRQRMRDEVLATTHQDFITLGKSLANMAQSDAVVALGAQSALEAAEIDLDIIKIVSS